jgi:flagellar motor switch protein FliN/FliY
MSDMISQAEIDALLGGAYDLDESDAGGGAASASKPTLTSEEQDILGEAGNISMGTSATTLSTLLGQRVDITTPNVQIMSWDEIASSYDRPCVGIRIDYTTGIKGSNILVMRESDVKVISNLMLGGDGTTGIDEPLNEIDLSAISEAMNQMVGSSSTSLSSMIAQKIDIDTPEAFQLDFTNNSFFERINTIEDPVVCVRFRMEIGHLVDSNIMQILPFDFSKDLVKVMREKMFPTSTPAAPVKVEAPASAASAPQPMQQQPMMQQQQRSNP